MWAPHDTHLRPFCVIIFAQRFAAKTLPLYIRKILCEYSERQNMNNDLNTKNIRVKLTIKLKVFVNISYFTADQLCVCKV